MIFHTLIIHLFNSFTKYLAQINKIIIIYIAINIYYFYNYIEIAYKHLINIDL